MKSSIKYRVEEKAIRIIFKIENEKYVNIIGIEQFEKISKELYVKSFNTVEEGIEFIQKITAVSNEIEGVLILKDYIIRWNDSDEAYEFMNLLFKPKQSIGDYGLSRINFYTEIEGDTYSVDLDYGFDSDIKISISKILENQIFYTKFKDYMVNFEKIIDNILEEE